MKRGYTVITAGAILLAAGILIIIPSVLTIYSAITSVSLNDVVRVVLGTVLGWFGIEPDIATPPESRMPIALSAAGIVVSPILMVDGAIALIAGFILSIADRRKERKATTMHRTDVGAA